MAFDCAQRYPPMVRVHAVRVMKLIESVLHRLNDEVNASKVLLMTIKAIVICILSYYSQINDNNVNPKCL